MPPSLLFLSLGEFQEVDKEVATSIGNSTHIHHTDSNQQHCSSTHLLAAMVEEFTFPTVVSPEQYYRDGAEKLVPFPRFGASPPPPWFVVSGGGGAAATDHHRRCFSAVVENAGGRDGDSDSCYGYRRGSERFAAAVVKEEHKMDMLWEDFNEELACAAPPPCPISKEWASEAWLPGDDRHVAVASGSVVRRRRLSLMMMLKLLRKLFLSRKSKASSSLPQGGGRRHQYD